MKKPHHLLALASLSFALVGCGEEAPKKDAPPAGGKTELGPASGDPSALEPPAPPATSADAGKAPGPADLKPPESGSGTRP